MFRRFLLKGNISRLGAKYTTNPTLKPLPRSKHPLNPQWEAYNSNNFQLCVAYSEQSTRKEFRDSHRILPVLDEQIPRFSYLGIYDGNGHSDVLDLLENNLHRVVAKELAVMSDLTIADRITKSFFDIDKKTRKLNISGSCATAVIALLSHNPDYKNKNMRQLTVANVGDSRAILVFATRPSHSKSCDQTRTYYTHRLSHDHKSTNSPDNERILSTGGTKIRNLQPSGAFVGDDPTTFLPYITVTDLGDHGECPMLILASDGIWDALTDQEAADLLMARYLKEGPFHDAAYYLVKTALQRGAGEHITAIVAFL